MTKCNAAFLSIVSNLILIILKLIAGFSIGSISIISEAIHSSIDLLASIIAFFSIKKASKAADYDHPFGHGKYENVSGFVESILIFFAALLIITEAIKKIIAGSNINVIHFGLVVMIVSALVNFIISSVLMKISKKTNSIALEADAMHLLTDVFTALGVCVGLILVKLTGISIIDPITALIVACFIVKASFDLTQKSLKDLLDFRLPDKEIEEIKKVIYSYDEINGYHRLRTRQCGEKKEIDLHLEINSQFTLVEAHNLCNKIEQDLLKIFPNSYIMIHAEPRYLSRKIGTFKG